LAAKVERRGPPHENLSVTIAAASYMVRGFEIDLL